jgi:hypothetical protein
MSAFRPAPDVDMSALTVAYDFDVLGEKLFLCLLLLGSCGILVVLLNGVASSRKHGEFQDACGKLSRPAADARLEHHRAAASESQKQDFSARGFSGIGELGETGAMRKQKSKSCLFWSALRWSMECQMV